MCESVVPTEAQPLSNGDVSEIRRSAARISSLPSESGDESPPVPELYEIDGIVGKKGKGPKIKYKVKWATGEYTWESVQRLRQYPDVMHMVRNYFRASSSS